MARQAQKMMAIGLFSLLLVVSALFEIAEAEWVLNDNGEKIWWEAPPAPKYNRKPAPRNKRNQSNFNAEIVFAMDTSGSMSDEFSTLCTRIDTIVNGLKAKGINVEPHIYGINGTLACATDTIYNIISKGGNTPVVSHEEDWAPAITDLANHYPWKPNYTKIVIPMSDEDPYNGSPWTDAEDGKATDEAISAANNNGVVIIPVVCSGYTDSVRNAAEKMADSTHGRVLISKDPDADLINGIVESINSSIGGITATDIFPYCYIDDAWENPKNTSIHKLPGDIIQLVCQINNNTEGLTNNIPVKLTFDYPDNWQFVLNDQNAAVKKRSAMEANEETVLAGDIQVQNSSVTISNIQVPPKSGGNPGRSYDYLVKLIIPKNKSASDISFKVEWNDPNDNRLRARTENIKVDWKDPNDNRLGPENFSQVKISIQIKRFIVTNRNLLYKRYGCGIGKSVSECKGNEDVNFILANLYKLASQQQAYVFYADWWDLYDNFSGIQNDPSDNPIANWDRNVAYGCTSDGGNCTQYGSLSESDINQVANKIDEYTHYWADQSGGKSNQHWMLIFGDDQVIPFYRAKDPTMNQSHYDSSPHTLSMAQCNWVFTESKYQDTNNQGWVIGSVDNMYVGRILSNNSNKLKEYSDVIVNRLGVKNIVDANDITLTSGKAGPIISSDGKPMTLPTGEKLYICGEDKEFRDVMLKAERYFDHIVCQSNGTCSDDCKNGNWMPTCLLGSNIHEVNNIGQCTITEAWTFPDSLFSSTFITYLDHGSPKKTYNFEGKSINKTFLNFPTFHIFACLCGLADGDDPDLITYSIINSKASSYLGATTVTHEGHDVLFVDKFYEKLSAQISIGESLNEAKSHAQEKNKGKFNDGYSLSNLGFTLYGIPWLEYKTPQITKNSSKRSIKREQDMAALVLTSDQSNEIQKNLYLSVSDGSYQIVNKDNFQFIEIDGFSNLRYHQQPILPVSRLQISIPENSVVTNVSITASSAINIGVVNIPIFNDYPRIVDMPSQPIYLELPASIGMFDPIKNPMWFEANSATYKDVVVDLVPIVFNSATKEATLYKNLTVTVTYQTEKEGVLQSIALNDTENAESVIAAIENTSSHTASFNVSGMIKDISGVEIENKTGLINIDSGKADNISLNFSPISKAGAYFMEVVASDSTGEIGRQTKQFNISSGQITGFSTSPNITGGDSCSLSVSYKNENSGNQQTIFKILFYNGMNYVGETVPIVMNIPTGNQDTANFQWNVPEDFSGNYRAIASATNNGETSTLSKELTVEAYSPAPSGVFDQTVYERNIVTLTGSSSSTATNQSYQWTFVGKSPDWIATPKLSDPTSANPTFTAPEVGIDGGSLVFQLNITSKSGKQNVYNYSVKILNIDSGLDDGKNGKSCFISAAGDVPVRKGFWLLMAVFAVFVFLARKTQRNQRSESA